MRKTIFAFLTGLMIFGTITAASASPDSKNQTAKKPKVQTGIDTLLPDYKKQAQGKTHRTDHQSNRSKRISEKQCRYSLREPRYQTDSFIRP